MADDPPILHVNCHVVVGIPGVSEDMLFRDFAPPSMQLMTNKAQSWVANGQPVNSVGGGRKLQWGTATFGRGVDPGNKCYAWLKACEEGDATAQKKEITAEVMAQDGSTLLQTWTLHGALPESLNWSSLGAEGADIFTETLTVSFDTAEMTPGG